MPTIYIDIQTKPIYDHNGELDGYDTEEYEYEYDYEILQKMIIKEFAEEYNLSLDTAKQIIEDLDLYDTLEDRYSDWLEDDLKEELYDKAYAQWENERDD